MTLPAYRGIGVAYYPEHWDKNLWEDDVERMLAHGIDTLRIAEFAWSKFEPNEGVFALDYFDEFLEICQARGMKVIFCTPTATPPVWMQETYPEILNCDRSGNPIDGPRRNYTYNSPTYNRFCNQIVEKLAAHYGQHPAIVGWQIDNEINCEIAEFFSPSDHVAFREFMKAKYETLDNLNQALGTTFWSRSYSDWRDVRLGKQGLHDSVNPHLVLEEKRFFSHSAIRFVGAQVDILRKHISREVWITTNGLFENLDYNKLIDAGLDFITFDSYPNFAHDVLEPERPQGDFKDRKWSWSLAWTRSISPVFGIMEQQSGGHGWTDRMMTPAPKPGQLRLWTYQSVAHGADFISYFRWRTSPMGQEIYWHGLNDYSNRPNRRLSELKQVTEEFARLAELQGAKYQAKVAILRDYNNTYDAVLDNWHSRVDRASDDAWFRAVQLTHTPCDFVFLNEDISLKELASYDLLVYPHAAILEPWQSDLLKEYVSAGGKLILGARTGYKDASGLCPMRPMPGLVSEWVGVTVEDYTNVSHEFKDMTLAWGDLELAAPTFSETLVPADEETTVLATFTQDYYAGAAALVHRRVGSGEVYYLGACFSEELAREFLRVTGVISPLAETISAPEDVEIAVREGREGKWLFVLNYQSAERTLELKVPVRDGLTGEQVQGETVLPPFGVGIYRVA